MSHADTAAIQNPDGDDDDDDVIIDLGSAEVETSAGVTAQLIVRKATGNKCGRCWKFCPSVAAAADVAADRSAPAASIAEVAATHEGDCLCARCQDALSR